MFQSRDRKMMGDMNGAKIYGSKASFFNGCALAIIIILIILMIVMMVMVVQLGKSVVNQNYGRYNMYN